MRVLSLALAAAATFVSGETYYKETFGKDWGSRWVHSTKGDNNGKFTLSAGEWYGDAEASKGIKTSQDARFYHISSKMAKPFSNEGKDLVVQYQVRHTQKIDCGGAYLKLLPSTVDQAGFNGDSEYNIMFGPDICGATKRVHNIFNYNGKNLLTKKEIKAETDQLSHVYTLIVKPDNTYEVRVDGEKKESGNLSDDWDFLLPKKIKDPAQSKPADWVDEAMINDPEDKKPEGYDDIPKMIKDPEAVKPDDWDDEFDGEWAPAEIDNPEFKGEWKAKRIDNPDYKGPWVHPEIDNPDYKEDPNLYKYADIGAIGFDLWQVKSGTIFDNIIVTDSIEEAEAFLKETYGATKDAEKKMFDDIEAKKAAAEAEERKKMEEERKKDEAEDDEDDEDDEEDEREL